MARKPIIGKRLSAAVCLTLVLLAATVSVTRALSIHPEQQFAFAEQLFQNNQFRRAGEEFQRFAFFFPADARRREALFRAGEAFFRAEDFPAALQLFNQLASQVPLDKEAVQAYFMLAETHLRLGSPSQALVQLHNLISLSDDPAIFDRAYFRMAWINIEQMDWEGARRSLQRISPDSPYPVDELNAALGETHSIPTKNPVLAGTLSIIPGAGQLYTGRYQDALTAFIINTGLIWAAVEAFDEEQYALGGLLGFVGSGFYIANIYGAVSDAHKYNQNQRRNFIEWLKQRAAVQVQPLSGTDGTQWRFQVAIDF